MDAKQLKDDAKQAKDITKRAKDEAPAVKDATQQAKDNQARAAGMDVLKNRGYSDLVRLDAGGQGTVYKLLKNGATFAAKVVHVDDENHKLEDDLKRELSIIKNVKHPNCIRVEDIFRTKHKVFIVMEFMSNKSIIDEVDRKGPLCEWKTKLYFTQIISGIKYLHHNKIAHRDLKLDNVLLDAFYNPKVCDYGFSRFVENDAKTGEVKKSKTFVGTSTYKPPEVQSKLAYDPFKCDVWCLGVCLFVMLNYEYPFSSSTGDKTTPAAVMIENKNKRNYKFQSKVETNISNCVKDLVQKLLEPNPKERIGISDVSKHNWIPNTFQ